MRGPIIRASNFMLADDDEDGQDASSALTMAEQITLSTVRLECELARGRLRRGTGFFYRFYCGDGASQPAIVTNAHVVLDARQVSFHVFVGDSEALRRENGHHRITVGDVSKAVIRHPDPTIDLCAILVDNEFIASKAIGIVPYFRVITKDIALTTEESELTSPIEDVIVVGYPVGLWDSVNNRPIVRRGITATPMDVDFDGKPEFLIDAASFEGASGSPVFLYQSHFGQTSEGVFTFFAAPRTRFVGVLTESEEHSREAELTNVFATSESGATARVEVPLHIGHVVKARCLVDLELEVQRTLMRA
jgi:hypothetical protein